jgi:hypothetical protein
MGCHLEWRSVARHLEIEGWFLNIGGRRCRAPHHPAGSVANQAAYSPERVGPEFD